MSKETYECIADEHISAEDDRKCSCGNDMGDGILVCKECHLKWKLEEQKRKYKSIIKILLDLI